MYMGDLYVKDLTNCHIQKIVEFLDFIELMLKEYWVKKKETTYRIWEIFTLGTT